MLLKSTPACVRFYEHMQVLHLSLQKTGVPQRTSYHFIYQRFPPPLWHPFRGWGYKELRFILPKSFEQICWPH